MNKLIKILITTLILIPTITSANFSVGWQATSTTQGWVFPNLVNGINQGIQVPFIQSGFVNVDKYSSYRQDGNTIFYASSTNFSTLGGIGASPNLAVSGIDNTAFGYHALNIATSSTDNTAIGYLALAADGNTLGTNGAANTAVGSEALLANTIGTENNAFGISTLIKNTFGSDNEAIGGSALANNTTGNQNTAVGTFSLLGNAAGSDNVTIGYLAGANTSVTTGFYSNNVLIGANIMSNLSAFITATSTIAIGNSAIGGTTFGSGSIVKDIAIGDRSGQNLTKGSNNIFLGSNSGINMSTGNRNTLIGNNDATTGGYTTGNGNIIIGDTITPLSVTSQNTLDIGNLIYASKVASTTVVSNGMVGISTSTPYANFSIQTASSTGDAFAVATSSQNAIFGVDNDGHQWTSGPAPVITNGTVVGDDQGGTITTSTAISSVTMTFSKAFRLTPYCNVSDDSPTISAYVSSISTTAVTFSLSAPITTGHLYYACGYHK